MPLNWWPGDPRFWRFIVTALRIRGGRGSLADHKRLLRMIDTASVRDKRKITPTRIVPGDAHRPAPVRDRWPGVVQRLDYRARLGEIRAPTLVGVGRYDPQAPPACSMELARGIPQAQLVVFRQSGHRPWVEEPDRFVAVLLAFLAQPMR
jgi:pimeloyl-ACP methyl ester carboxylesterase